MTTLSRDTVADLPDTVGRPAAVPGQSRPAIVHIGIGNFHRSHMERYLDDLLREHGQPRWTVHGVGVLPSDESMIAELRAQDYLYTLVEKSADGSSNARVIGAMRTATWLPDPVERGGLVDAMASTDIAIVSLTITEGGYPVDVDTLVFNPEHPSVAGDLNGRWRNEPLTAFGLILSALTRRRAAGLPPFTVMSCDNIRHNGAVTRAAVLGLAEREAPDLVTWLSCEGAFPSSMVDRITPVTTEHERDAVARTIGMADHRPVICEDFLQWVLEDQFSCGRPELQTVGVQMVEDVEPYELMKLRLLNAGHQVIGHIGRLAGLTYTHEAIDHPVVRGLLEQFMREEAAPTLPPVPGQDLARYRTQLVSRFGNRAVGDTLARLCADASDRIPKFLLGTIVDNLSGGGPLRISALTLAAWSAGSLGRTEGGAEFAVVDPLASSLQQSAAADVSSPGAFLEHPLFASIANNHRFRQEYRLARELVSQIGVLEAGRQCLH